MTELFNLTSSTAQQDNARQLLVEGVEEVKIYSPLEQNVLKSALREVSDEIFFTEEVIAIIISLFSPLPLPSPPLLPFLSDSCKQVFGK